MSKAAGILFQSLNGNVLFLRRTETAPDCPSCWDFPGGGAESGEDAETCAIRETREEIGFLPEGKRVFHTKTLSSAVPAAVGVGASAAQFPVVAGAPDSPDNAEAAPITAEIETPLAMPEGVEFSTFKQKVTNEFIPELNYEHDGYCWTPPGAPPQPLHPGCQVALDRISWNELDVAKAIADGRLTSPQRYENVWLFAIRITGTNVAYRDKFDEFVVRKPENYLTPEFLERCNGLAVIFKHPPKALLNSEEFANRIVGTVFYPYIAGDEVWAVTKIYDDVVAKLMAEGNLSTSPGVNFADFSVNAKITLSDGERVLLEGKPSLLDHVAICELGVWDKGGDPSGIRAETREDSAMADEDDKKEKVDAKRDDAKRDDAKRDDTKKADAEDKEKDRDDSGKRDDKKRDDADAGTTISKQVDAMMDACGKMMDAVGSMSKRMDAFEAKEKERDDARRADAKRDDAKKADDKDDKDNEDKDDEPKKAAADKSKKDSAKKDEDDKDEKSKDDSKRDDSMSGVTAKIAKLEADLADARGMIPKDIGDADYTSLLDEQARADKAFRDLGQNAPRPLQGERPATYRRRVARMLKTHSPTWKDVEITTMFADDAGFGVVYDQILKEASITGRNPVNVPGGALRAIERKEDGHIIRDFVGEPRAWMDMFAGPVQLRGTGQFKQQNLGNRAN